MSDKLALPAASQLYLGSDRLWFDPIMLDAACSIIATDISFPNGVNKLARPANARRWVIGFFPGALGGTYKVAPWPDVDAFQFTLNMMTAQPLFFKLFDYGPVVCSAWFVQSSALQTIRVVEVIRN